MEEMQLMQQKNDNDGKKTKQCEDMDEGTCARVFVSNTECLINLYHR